MANNKSSKKRIRQIERRTLRNRMAKSAVRTAMKKVTAAIAARDKETAVAQFKVFEKMLDTAEGKGIFHTNMAARKKSRLMAQINKIQ